jgi:hypothetical protein
MLVSPERGAGEDVSADHHLALAMLLEADRPFAGDRKSGVTLANRKAPEELRWLGFPVAGEWRSRNDAVPVWPEKLREPGEVSRQLDAARF